MKLAEWNGRDPQPGDVLQEDGGDRSLVAAVEMVRARSQMEIKYGCVFEKPAEDEVTIWVIGSEPAEAIAPGGGIIKVPALIQWWGDPKTTHVLHPTEHKTSSGS